MDTCGLLGKGGGLGLRVCDEIAETDLGIVLATDVADLRVIGLRDTAAGRFERVISSRLASEALEETFSRSWSSDQSDIGSEMCEIASSSQPPDELFRAPGAARAVVASASNGAPTTLSGEGQAAALR